MTEAQFIALRDKMIAAQKAGPSPLAVKFDPMLRDRAKIDDRLPADQAELDRLEAECMDLAAKLHAEAIAKLKDELAADLARVDNPPAGERPRVGYAGKTPEEVQKLLSASVEVTEAREIQAPNVLQDRDLHLAALMRGVDLDTIRAEYARIKPASTVVVEVVPEKCFPAPIAKAWDGIGYCRNIPSLDNIAEAMK